MIVCPNCAHPNPEGATQCEACYTPLPSTMSCPNCGAEVQTDAGFCGQCGFNLQQATVVRQPETAAASSSTGDLPEPDITAASQPDILPETQSPSPSPTPPPVATPSGSAATQLQVQKAKLLHTQTDTEIELPQNLSVIHVGKPNEQIPPDIDVSGFPNSDVVSRIHADIRVEGDTYYIEDVGSTNGTYINHNPLPPGNRHRLRPGDRIALGKGDKVTFIFQMS